MQNVTEVYPTVYWDLAMIYLSKCGNLYNLVRCFVCCTKRRCFCLWLKNLYCERNFSYAMVCLIIVYLVWYILNLTPVRPPNKIIISFLLVSMLICYDFEQQTSYSPYSIITRTIVESRLIISVWIFCYKKYNFLKRK